MLLNYKKEIRILILFLLFEKESLVCLNKVLLFIKVILEKKSVTPIPLPSPLSLPTGLGEPGESGVLGGMKIERNMGVPNFKTIEKKKNSKFPNLTI